VDADLIFVYQEVMEFQRLHQLPLRQSASSVDSTRKTCLIVTVFTVEDKLVTKKAIAASVSHCDCDSVAQGRVSSGDKAKSAITQGV
jgi:hypothetical protein